MYGGVLTIRQYGTLARQQTVFLILNLIGWWGVGDDERLSIKKTPNSQQVLGRCLAWDDAWGLSLILICQDCVFDFDIDHMRVRIRFDLYVHVIDIFDVHLLFRFSFTGVYYELEGSARVFGDSSR